MAEVIVDYDKFLEDSRDFAAYLYKWRQGLKPAKIDDIVKEAGGSRRVGVFCVDMVEGFCREGALASARVKSIIPGVVGILQKCYEAGVRDFALTQDSHGADSLEFGSFPPHCVKGTPEAETISEIRDLPFFSQMKIFKKNSISSDIGTDLETWIEENDFTRMIVLGDCTDLCVYQLAMYLRLLSNAGGEAREIICVADAIDTYDLPVNVAQDLGVFAHPGDYFHMLFLYHMVLNGVRVVSELF